MKAITTDDRATEISKLLSNEVFQIAIINRYLPRVHELNAIEKQQYDLALTQIEFIKNKLNCFTDYELSICRVIRNKDTNKQKAERINYIVKDTLAHDNIDNVKSFLVSIVLLYHKAKNFTQDDLLLMFAGIDDCDGFLDGLVTSFMLNNEVEENSNKKSIK